MPMCWTWWSRASAWAAERACLPTALKACIAQAFFFAGSQHRAQHSQQVVPDAAAPGPGVDLGDRKSTRLNSSHQIISYAVFCLKKKKRSIHSDLPPSTVRDLSAKHS